MESRYPARFIDSSDYDGNRWESFRSESLGRGHEVILVVNMESRCLFCNLMLPVEDQGWWKIHDCPVCGRYKMDAANWRRLTSEMASIRKKTMTQKGQFRRRIKLENYEGRTFVFSHEGLDS
jgi:hypothetical protein